MTVIPRARKSPFQWECPRCRQRLPDSTLLVATRILNERHLPLCKGPVPVADPSPPTYNEP